MDNSLVNYEYNNYSDYLSVDDKLKYLKTVKANLIINSYIKLLINNLYINIINEKKGYANEMIGDNSLFDYSHEAVASIVPLLKDNAEIIRGYLVDDECYKIMHSWIRINISGTDYVFDPALNLIVLKKDYDGIFLSKEMGKVSANRVKNDMIDILNDGEKAMDGSRIIHGTNDINSSFYKSDMFVKGTVINKKILMLGTSFNKK